MQHILVPTDFSPTSEKALFFAAYMADKCGSAITFYHAYTPVESMLIESEKQRLAYNAEQEQDAARKMEAIQERVRQQHPAARIDCVVGRTPMVQQMLQYCHQNDVDFIVMGTQGATGLKRVIIGSAAVKVMGRSDIPVLLVPEAFDMTPPRQIVFAARCIDSDTPALSFLLPLAKEMNAGTTIFHLYDLYDMEEEAEMKNFDAYAETIRNAFPRFPLQFRLQKTVSVHDALEHLDAHLPYDMAVMVRRKKTLLENFFLDSFSKNMAYITHKPLLIIPETGEDET